uniref:DDE Tnp4 domain-containing protein n=1 Tax=Cannabis sativa TaxID=3483 RepID=A0A803QZU5_CANSA
MCICSFDMKFPYVVAGWEGSTNDARILSECATNPDYEFPAPPHVLSLAFQEIKFMKWLMFVMNY